eukprot:EG_transcript_23892
MLPCAAGNVDPTGKPKWDAILEVLERPLRDTTELVRAIQDLNPFYRHRWDFRGLCHFVDVELTPAQRDAVFSILLPKMKIFITHTPKLFPKPLQLLVSGCPGMVELTSDQVACLLANAFFCTFPHRNDKGWPPEYKHLPPINFSGLFQAQGPREAGPGGGGQAGPAGCSPSQAAKFRCFL